jgi:hypothetical protein
MGEKVIGSGKIGQTKATPNTVAVIPLTHVGQTPTNFSPQFPQNQVSCSYELLWRDTAQFEIIFL